MPGQDIFADMNVEILKMPLGFIKIVQLVLVIIAFSSLAGYHVNTAYESPTSNSSVTLAWGYPFDLVDVSNELVLIPADSTTSLKKTKPVFHQSYAPSSHFFVFIGVKSLVAVIAFAGIYIFAWHNYENQSMLPKIDFLITVYLALCWILGTIIMWSSVIGIETQTDQKRMIAMNLHDDKACTDESNPCSFLTHWGFAGLTIAILAGWACSLLFAANAWFTYKETAWFFERSMLTSSRPPNDFNAYSSPYNAGSSPFESNAPVHQPSTRGYQGV